MSCTNCEPIEGGGNIIINEPQQPFCDQCGDDASCDEKLDSACVIYHLDFPNKVPRLDNLGLGNGASAEEIFEAINDLVGNHFNIPLTAIDTDSINLTTSGILDHTLKADVKVSGELGNILQIKADGVFVPDLADGKVKVDASDTKDYLINQIVGGTDGIVSTSSILTDGLVQILPHIDIDALVVALGESVSFKTLICRLVKECQGECPDVNSITTTITT